MPRPPSPATCTTSGPTGSTSPPFSRRRRALTTATTWSITPSSTRRAAVVKGWRPSPRPLAPSGSACSLTSCRTMWGWPLRSRASGGGTCSPTGGSRATRRHSTLIGSSAMAGCASRCSAMSRTPSSRSSRANSPTSTTASRSPRVRPRMGHPRMRCIAGRTTS